MDRIAGLLREMGSGPVFVHVDAFRAARLVPPVRDRSAWLDSHIELLRRSAGDRPLWCPTFNYDFGKSRVYDVANSESDLGPITERFRTAAAEWRTPVPIFPVSGIGAQPGQGWGRDTDPFGPDSMFAELIEKDGVVFYYGDTFHYTTLVHRSERASGGPVYRYDKEFGGDVVMTGGAVVPGTLVYHVRPLGAGLDYDWARLLAEALEAGVCRRLDGAGEVLAASARGLHELWLGQLRDDPLALLDSQSRKWVEPAIEELGRRFIITDFEGPLD